MSFVGHRRFALTRPQSSLMVLFVVIIHQIFSLACDRSKRVTWANTPQLKLGNIRGYNSPINFHVILLATLRHVV